MIVAVQSSKAADIEGVQRRAPRCATAATRDCRLYGFSRPKKMRPRS